MVTNTEVWSLTELANMKRSLSREEFWQRFEEKVDPFCGWLGQEVDNFIDNAFVMCETRGPALKEFWARYYEDNPIIKLSFVTTGVPKYCLDDVRDGLHMIAQVYGVGLVYHKNLKVEVFGRRRNAKMYLEAVDQLMARPRNMMRVLPKDDDRVTQTKRYWDHIKETGEHAQRFYARNAAQLFFTNEEAAQGWERRVSVGKVRNRVAIAHDELIVPNSSPLALHPEAAGLKLGGILAPTVGGVG